MKKKWCTIAALAVNIVLLVGLVSFLDACGPKEDGSFMMCHHARNVLLLFGTAIAVFHLLGLFLPEKYGFEKGLALASFIVCVCAVLIPQKIIPLCMMNTMRCHTVMRPGALVFLGLIIGLDILRIKQLNGTSRIGDGTGS